MDRENGIEIAGLVKKVISDRLADIEFPNKHRIMGFISRDDEENYKNKLVHGAQVVVICSPFDFSKGRIIKIE